MCLNTSTCHFYFSTKSFSGIYRLCSFSEFEQLNSYLKECIVSLWIPHHTCINRNFIFFKNYMFRYLQCRMNNTWRISVKMRIISSFIQCKGTSNTCIYIPSFILIDWIFYINECRIFIGCIACIPIPSK